MAACLEAGSVDTERVFGGFVAGAEIDYGDFVSEVRDGGMVEEEFARGPEGGVGEDWLAGCKFEAVDGDWWVEV